MSLKNLIRNALHIRRERALAPAGPMPQIGSSIVRDKLRIRLKYPLSKEQWNWFTANGWRTVDMRNNRRQYISVPDNILLDLLDLLELEGPERAVLHARLIKKDSAAHNSVAAAQPGAAGKVTTG